MRAFKTVREEWWTGQIFDKSPITIHRLSEILRCHIAPYFDQMDIEVIDDVMINHYIQQELQHGNRLTGESLSQNSVIKAMNILYRIFNYAVLKGYIKEKTNPMLTIKKLKKVPTKEFSIYHREEIEKLIVVARPKWLGDIILLAYNTGMRKGEIYGLQWEDIDFEKGILQVNHSVTSSGPNVRYVGNPKTKTSKRQIRLDNRTIEMLQRRFLRRLNEEWVFCKKDGTPLSPWYNVKYFRKACVDAGIPIRRFHDIRHTHITELVRAGISLPIVQQRAGHSDIRMTMHYTHIAFEAQQAVVDFMNVRDSKQPPNHTYGCD